jgi:hypothetical protein
MTPSGRTKTYASLEHLNITLQPDDLKRLDAIPGNSRNERIAHLLGIYDLAAAIVAAYDGHCEPDITAGCECEAISDIMDAVIVLTGSMP